MRQFDTGAARDTDTNKLELVWAAGFYDGEGSVSCTANNGKPMSRVQLSIGQREDAEGVPAATLERFMAAVGCGKIYVKSRRGHDIHQHQYIVSSRELVFDVCNKLWPYISEVKKLQMLRAHDNLLGGPYASV